MTGLLHLVFEMLAYIVGFRYFLYLRARERDRIADSNRAWIIVAAATGALLGSRLLGALEHPENLLHTRQLWLDLYANKTIVGALLGGLIAVELTKKILGETHSSGDLFTFPLVLAIMIGRIGCFINGLHEETYGTVTTFFLGMDLGDGLKRHPVALYEIAFLGLLWFFLARLRLLEGYRFQFFMIAYLTFRFFLDFIKPHFPVVAGLGSIQICCLLGLLYYAPTIRKIFANFSVLTVHG